MFSFFFHVIYFSFSLFFLYFLYIYIFILTFVSLFFFLLLFLFNLFSFILFTIAYFFLSFNIFFSLFFFFSFLFYFLFLLPPVCSHCVCNVLYCMSVTCDFNSSFTWILSLVVLIPDVEKRCVFWQTVLCGSDLLCITVYLDSKILCISIRMFYMFIIKWHPRLP